MPEALPNRWRFAGAAILMQVCLGVIYSWSVFRGPLGQAYGWDKTVTIMPYRWSLLFFTFGMIVAGFWQDKKGARLVGSVGGFLLSVGCLLAAFIGNTPQGLTFAYGVVGGLGVGFAYVTPIATLIKWFPDQRGRIVGLAVMGFGVGPLLFAPLLEACIGRDPAQFAVTLPRTFFILAGIFFVFVIGAAQMYRVPPAGWRPEGWNPPAVSAAAKENFTTAEVIRGWQFYALWLVFFLGTSVGLTAIGEATPLLQEVVKQGAAMSAGTALGVMSIFNGVGRLVWGGVSDRIGRNRTVVAMCCISILSCIVFLRNAAGFWQLLIGLCLAGFAYGGYLAIMPSFTADFYGPKNVGANYGLLFSAWGLCGFIVPGYFAGIMEQAKRANDLVGGYNQVYLSLAAIAAAGAMMAMLVRRPSGSQ